MFKKQSICKLLILVLVLSTCMPSYASNLHSSSNILINKVEDFKSPKSSSKSGDSIEDVFNSISIELEPALGDLNGSDIGKNIASNFFEILKIIIRNFSGVLSTIIKAIIKTVADIVSFAKESAA